MSRTILPLIAADVSQMARQMSRELADCDGSPSHVQMLNMLARSAGFRNFQHLKAQWDAQDRLSQPPLPVEPVDYRRVLRVSRHFDRNGKLLRWPKKTGERHLCLWVMWSEIPAGQNLSEAAINALLTDNHLFGDYALLRRYLCDLKMMERTVDGRIYRRVESRPPADACALIRHLRQQP
ncbi:MAG: DUF2087 domain-containing protein [Magnetospirillum sp.]